MSKLRGKTIENMPSANMDDNEELPFRLVGMSREELNKELYADIPSDNESGNDSDANDIESEVSDEYIRTPEIELENDNDWDDEDLSTLNFHRRSSTTTETKME
ncbi:hypothetical protein JTB14_000209 [Gonioctena quinquepunctata]|nr:hypothetical protein JTB14_000209 [Gonioctena quinquepunctata]